MGAAMQIHMLKYQCVKITHTDASSSTKTLYKLHESNTEISTEIKHRKAEPKGCSVSSGKTQRQHLPGIGLDKMLSQIM